MRADVKAAIGEYEAAAIRTVNAHVAFKKAHAEATIAADGKNAEARAAQADLASLAPRLAYESLKAHESAFRAQVDFLIAAAHGGHQ